MLCMPKGAARTAFTSAAIDINLCFCLQFCFWSCLLFLIFIMFSCHYFLKKGLQVYIFKFHLSFVITHSVVNKLKRLYNLL